MRYAWPRTFTLNGATTRGYVGQLTGLGISTTRAYGQVQVTIQQQAAMIATSDLFWGIAALFIALIGRGTLMAGSESA